MNKLLGSWPRPLIIGLIWLPSILALNGCAPSRWRMESPANPPPAALTVQCPALPPGQRKLEPTLQDFLSVRRLYRLCATRHADLVRAISPPATNNKE